MAVYFALLAVAICLIPVFTDAAKKKKQTIPGVLTNGAWIDSAFERLIGKSDGAVIGEWQ